MGKIIIDDAQLANVTAPTQLYDKSGKFIGYIVPAPDLSEWDLTEPDISEEELDRRANSPGKWYTTAEVLAHLKSLENG